MTRIYSSLATLIFIISAGAAEAPVSFPNTTTAIQWACSNIDATPNVIIIQTGAHQVLALWGKPDAETNETSVLTLIKSAKEKAVPFVRYETLESWDVEMEGEPIEHFGIIHYDKESDHIYYHTNVRRQLLLQSLPVTECYNLGANNALKGTPLCGAP